LTNESVAIKFRDVWRDQKISQAHGINRYSQRLPSSFRAETELMTATILSLPAWAAAVGVIGLAAAMIYILLGHGAGRG